MKDGAAYYTHALLGGYLVLFAALAIDPPSGREVWLAENLPIVCIVGFLVLCHRLWFIFSNLSYLLRSVLVVMHTIGGHYTFAAVPFDWFTDFFVFERNHYDRIAHFSVGFYAFPIAEFLSRKHLTAARPVTYLFALFAIMAVAGTYEIMEWQFAVLGNPEAGIEVLGSQGDVWDAQKDILADTMGAVAALTLFHLVNGRSPVAGETA